MRPATLVTKHPTVLHILNHTHRLNGNVHAAVDLACAQANAGHRVIMCSSGGSFDEMLLANNVEIVNIDHKRTLFNVFRAVFKIAKICSKVDIVHAHMVTSAILSWPGCKLYNIPLITTVHNAFEKSSGMMRIGDRVIAVSKAVAKSIILQGIPEKRIRTVLNGTIGVARFAVQPPPVHLSGAINVLFVGGLHPRKGVKDLIDAFSIVSKEHRDCILTIVGEGPYEVILKSQVSSLGCDSVILFAGSQVDPRGFFKAADIFVLPSHADPAPLVISEAREAGCAVIASNVDGIPELLECGRAGILVPPHSPRDLAKAINQLLYSAEALKQWKINSQLNIDNLNIDRVAKEVVAIYLDCL